MRIEFLGRLVAVCSCQAVVKASQREVWLRGARVIICRGMPGQTIEQSHCLKSRSHLVGRNANFSRTSFERRRRCVFTSVNRYCFLGMHTREPEVSELGISYFVQRDDP